MRRMEVSKTVNACIKDRIKKIRAKAPGTAHQHQIGKRGELGKPLPLPPPHPS